MKAKKEQFEELQNAMDLVGFENDVSYGSMKLDLLYYFYLLPSIKKTCSYAWQPYLTWVTLNSDKMIMSIHLLKTKQDLSLQ